MKIRIYLLALIGLAIVLAGSDAWAVCYVDQNAKGKNDGSSWTNAYVHPQLALINGCTEIWVAKGVYIPVLRGSDPTVSFDIPAGTKMYGGFAGGESSVDQRLPFINLTILSGDVDRNDHNVANWPNRTSADIVGTNSTNIVTFNSTSARPISSSTVLDGFLISGGDGYDRLTSGSAIFCSSETSSVDCAPVLNNLVLAGNKSWGSGAVVLQGTGDIAISNSVFSGNFAQQGGALFINKKTPATAAISKCAFVNNIAGFVGGAVAIYSSHVVFENVTFNGNKITSKSTYNDGGALGIVGVGEATLTNVTFVDNFTPNRGGALVAESGVTVMILNSLFWNNQAIIDPSANDTALFGPAYIAHSVLAAGCPAGATCGAIVSSDPRLSSVGDHGGSTITVLPGAGGSAIDTGDDSFCPSTDQRGVSRPQGAHCDIGAVEWQPSDDIIFRNGFQITR